LDWAVTISLSSSSGVSARKISFPSLVTIAIELPPESEPHRSILREMTLPSLVSIVKPTYGEGKGRESTVGRRGNQML
jgi:hypothetical protein